MIYTVWVAMALVIPALCLYILPARTQGRMNYWLLFWTFAYIAYLFHFYYAVMVHYHASIPEVFQQQGIKIAGSNFLVTFWWGLDVLLAWFVRCRCEMDSHRAARGEYFYSSCILCRFGRDLQRVR